MEFGVDCSAPILFYTPRMATEHSRSLEYCNGMILCCTHRCDDECMEKYEYHGYHSVDLTVASYESPLTLNAGWCWLVKSRVLAHQQDLYHSQQVGRERPRGRDHVPVKSAGIMFFIWRFLVKHINLMTQVLVSSGSLVSCREKSLSISFHTKQYPTSIVDHVMYLK